MELGSSRETGLVSLCVKMLLDSRHGGKAYQSRGFFVIFSTSCQ